MDINYIVPQGDLTVTPHKGPARYEPMAPFSVVCIGTGCPETVLGRGFPSTLVQYNGNYFLVDVAEGTNTRLAQGGIQNGRIGNVLFTHHHADHDAGYPYFLIDSWMTGRESLNLVGPPKTRQLHELVLQAYKEDIDYRATRGGSAQTGIYQVEIREIEDKDEFVLDGVTISTAKLTHTAHNIGYRFAVDGMVIVVSGDTSYDPALVELARDADILVMDAGGVKGNGFIGASNPMPEGTRMPPPRKRNQAACTVPPHPAPGQVARMAMEAGVKAVVLTHFTPIDADEEQTIASFREAGYTGEVTLAQDLMEFAPEKEAL